MADTRTALDYRHEAGLLRTQAYMVEETARAEAKALREQAAGLVLKAEDLEQENPVPGLPPVLPAMLY